MVLSRNAEVFIIFQFLFEFYDVYEKIKILGPWGAQGHGPFGPMGSGDRLDLKDPGPMGPGAHGPIFDRGPRAPQAIGGPREKSIGGPRGPPSNWGGPGAQDFLQLLGIFGVNSSTTTIKTPS